MNYVYRYMLGDQWIYVGKSEKNLAQRVHDHAKELRFEPYLNAVIEYCELNSKTDMDITESMMIKTMHPLLNVVDKTDGSIPFVYDDSAITWKRYVEEKYVPKISVKSKRDKPFSSIKFMKFIKIVVAQNVNDLEMPKFSNEHRFRYVVNIYDLMDSIGMSHNFIDQLNDVIIPYRKFYYSKWIDGPYPAYASDPLYDCEYQLSISDDQYIFDFIARTKVTCSYCKVVLDQTNFGGCHPWGSKGLVSFCEKCWPHIEYRDSGAICYISSKGA